MDSSATLGAFGLSLGATLLAYALLRVLGAVRRALLTRVGAFASAAESRLRLRGGVIVKARHVAAGARGTLNGVYAAAIVLTLYGWATFVLTRFTATHDWGAALGQFLVDSFAKFAVSILQAIPGLLTVAIIFIITRFLTTVSNSAFDLIEQGRLVVPWLHRDTAPPTRRIVTAMLWLFAIIVAYPYVPGSDSAAFKGVSVFTGLLLTIGSAGFVGQAGSGLVLMYSRGIRVGNFIQAGDVRGTVIDLGLLATRIRTPKNELVTLPNSVVVSGPITDFSAASDFGGPLLVHSAVTIGYDVPWRHVHELLIKAASEMEGALAAPTPFVLQHALDDSHMEYQVLMPVDPARASELAQLSGRLHMSIQDAFAGADVEILPARQASQTH
jgi:small-conductance mechanosensitive channel